MICAPSRFVMHTDWLALRQAVFDMHRSIQMFVVFFLNALSFDYPKRSVCYVRHRVCVQVVRCRQLLDIACSIERHAWFVAKTPSVFLCMFRHPSPRALVVVVGWQHPDTDRQCLADHASTIPGVGRRHCRTQGQLARERRRQPPTERECPHVATHDHGEVAREFASQSETSASSSRRKRRRNDFPLGLVKRNRFCGDEKAQIAQETSSQDIGSRGRLC